MSEEIEKSENLPREQRKTARTEGLFRKYVAEGPVGEKTSSPTQSKDNERIEDLRRGLSKPDVLTRVNKEIHQQAPLEQNQRRIERDRARAREGFSIKASRNPFVKAVLLGALMPAAWLGAKGAQRTVEHLRNADAAQEQTDYETSHKAMQTSINNMESQLNDPNLTPEEKARLEGNLANTSEMLSNTEKAHAEYTDQGSVKTTDQGIEATVSDGTHYSSSSESRDNNKTT